LKINGIILAGGKSLRLGQDKITAKVGEASLIEKVVAGLEPLCQGIIVVTAKERSFPQLEGRPGVIAVQDIYPGQGSLGGVYTGLVKSDSFYNLVVAADMPFLNGPLLHYMIEAADGFDFVLTIVGNFFEPLHAVYSRICVPAIENMLREGKRVIVELFNYVRVRYIEEEEINRFDPGHRSFFNINTREDLEKARRIARGSAQ
jgi:molybdopterin-guanine dinucleotide biosynthesis protein A